MIPLTRTLAATLLAAATHASALYSQAHRL